MTNSPENTTSGKGVTEANNSANSDDDIYHHHGGNMPEHSSHDDSTLSEEKVQQYWRENINLLVKLLVVWFVVSFGFGILFVDFLNQFSLFGMKLGFWFAQQGAIYVFIILIFTYVYRIKIIEQHYGVGDTDDSPASKMDSSKRDNNNQSESK